MDSGLPRGFQSVPSFNSLEGLTELNSLARAWPSTLGFGRVDSESAFQDFLKRIPSTSSLGALGGAGGPMDDAQAAHLQQQVQHYHTQLGSSALVGSAPPPASLQEPGSLDVGPGIPRVPSLDLLRQLVQQNQAQTQSTMPRPTSPTSPELKGESAGGSRAGSGLLPPPSLPLMMPTVPVPLLSPALLPTSVPSGVHTGISSGIPSGLPVGLSPGRLSPGGLSPGSGLLLATSVPQPAAVPKKGVAPSKSAAPKPSLAEAPPPAKVEPQSKAEIRRARRMLSNRESARRSRKRKQEHLSTLEEQLAEANKEKEALEDRVDKLEDEATAREKELERLRKEVETLRALQQEKGGEPAVGAGKRPRGAIQRNSSFDHLPKKAHKAANGRHAEWLNEQGEAKKQKGN